MTTTYLATLGGAPEPVFIPLHNLPGLQRVILLASPESEQSARDHITSLPVHLRVRIIHTPDVNDLALTYQTFRDHLLALPELAAPASLLCNITGGTKPMSAALMMLATELQLPMTYVGGTRRDKDGVGIVQPGHERQLPQQNPWSLLGLIELRRIKFLWDNAHFAAASELLATTGQRLGNPNWQTFSRLSEGLAARHRFDFKTADKTLKVVRRDLPDTHPLQDFVLHTRKTCETLAKSSTPGKGDPHLLLTELLASSALAANQHRYEDAAARLYRAIELWAQLHLHEQTSGSYWNGKLGFRKNPDGSSGEPFPVPEELTAPAFLDSIRCRAPYPERLGLTDLFLALDALAFAPAQTIASDIVRGRKESRFIRLTEKRNQSILAHGSLAVTSDKFQEMDTTLRDLLPDFPSAQPNLILPPPFLETWLQP